MADRSGNICSGQRPQADKKSFRGGFREVDQAGFQPAANGPSADLTKGRGFIRGDQAARLSARVAGLLRSNERSGDVDYVALPTLAIRIRGISLQVWYSSSFSALRES